MKAVFEQITEFELQKISLKSCNEKTEKDADKYSKDPEGKKDIQLLGTENSLKMIRNSFLFHLRSSICSQDIKTFVLTF